jgi:hypothetical protein
MTTVAATRQTIFITMKWTQLTRMRYTELSLHWTPF